MAGDPAHKAEPRRVTLFETEEWQLVQSLVQTSIPEDDLFAGIAVPAESRVSA